MEIPNVSYVFHKIFISYIDLMEHTDIRRKKLRDQYFFECQCLRCQGKKLSWFPGGLGDHSMEDYLVAGGEIKLNKFRLFAANVFVPFIGKVVIHKIYMLLCIYSYITLLEGC